MKNSQTLLIKKTGKFVSAKTVSKIRIPRLMATCQEGYCQPNFPPGSMVQCTTCLGEQVKGEVIAFDYPTKLLALSKNSFPQIT